MAKSTSSRKRRASTRPSLRMMALSALLAGLTIVVAVTWVAPQGRNVDDLTKQAQAAQAQIVAAQSRIADLKGGASRDAQSLLAQAQTLDAQLPNTVDKVALAASVPQRAASFGLTVTQMNPGTTASMGGAVSALSFAMGVKGDFAQVQSFLASLTTPGPTGALMGVQGVDVKIAAGTATATFTLNVYYSSVAPLRTATSPAKR